MALAWGTVFGACCTPRVMSGCTPPKLPNCVFSSLWFFCRWREYSATNSHAIPSVGTDPVEARDNCLFIVNDWWLFSVSYGLSVVL